jgi:hypothetical protein
VLAVDNEGEEEGEKTNMSDALCSISMTLLIVLADFEGTFKPCVEGVYGPDSLDYADIVGDSDANALLADL